VRITKIQSPITLFVSNMILVKMKAFIECRLIALQLLNK
jgi:hypothetical protein